MARRKLDGKEFESLRTRFNVTPQNEQEFFQREGADIYYAPRDRVLAAEDDLQQTSAARLDLPSLFKKAAQEANPNFGLSRSEILARFEDPQFSDTKSSSYVDPNTRLAIANRGRQGYQAVLGDAVSRADAILGRDVGSKQLALQSAQAEAQARAEAEKEERDFQRQIYLKQLGGGGGGGAPAGFSASLAAARASIDAGADPTAVAARLFAEYPDERTTINDALKGAGYSSAPSEDGGLSFFGPGGIPIAVEQFSAGRGIGLDEALAGSSNPFDIKRVRGIQEERAKINPLYGFVGR